LRRIDIGIGIFFVLLGLLSTTQSLQLELWQRGGIPGPGMFPLVLSILLIGLGGLMVVTRLRATPDAYPPFEKLSRDGFRRVVTVMIASVVSLVLLPILGYFVSSLVLVAFLIIFVERLRSWRAAVTVVALPVAFFLVFVVLLRIRLPGGFWDT
jgi:hypothetical protein